MIKRNMRKKEKSADAICIHIKLDYSKFYSSIFINLTGHFESFGLLELLYGSPGAAFELAVNLKVVSFKVITTKL